MDIATASVEIAARAASGYLTRHGLTANTDSLLSAIRANVKIRLPEAMADAKAALDCGMANAAEQTFAASMVLAGFDAAKESANPPAGSRGMTFSYAEVMAASTR